MSCEDTLQAYYSGNAGNFDWWSFWVAHFIMVGFEYRENHNGVGWRKFAKSVRQHINQGPHELIGLSHYEGKVSLEVLDLSKNVVRAQTSRGSYEDPRDMNTLKYKNLSVLSINGQVLDCANNFGESVHTRVSFGKDSLIATGLTSLNATITQHEIPLSNFGKQLPETFEVVDGEVLNFPNWLNIDTKRYLGCSYG